MLQLVSEHRQVRVRARRKNRRVDVDHLALVGPGQDRARVFVGAAVVTSHARAQRRVEDHHALAAFRSRPGVAKQAGYHGPDGFLELPDRVVQLAFVHPCGVFKHPVGVLARAEHRRDNPRRTVIPVHPELGTVTLGQRRTRFAICPPRGAVRRRSQPLGQVVNVSPRGYGDPRGGRRGRRRGEWTRCRGGRGECGGWQRRSSRRWKSGQLRWPGCRHMCRPTHPHRWRGHG